MLAVNDILLLIYFLISFYINLTDMKPWWDSLTDVDKYDITPIGHHSGTGLIVY